MNDRPSTLQKGPNLFDLAVRTALTAHKGQPRKGTDIPYVTHPLAVGFILAKAGCTDGVIVAGILHDLAEDTSFTLEEIGETFGDKVAEIVAGCSEPDKSLPWEVRKQHTIDELKRASLDIKYVALADKFHNISSMAKDYAEVGERLWDRFKSGRSAQKWYYEGLVDALSDDNGNEAYRDLYKQFAEKVDALFGARDAR